MCTYSVVVGVCNWLVYNLLPLVCYPSMYAKPCNNPARWPTVNVITPRRMHRRVTVVVCVRLSHVSIQ